MKTEMTIEGALSLLHDSVAKSIKMPKVCEINEVPPGWFFRQGDLYITLGSLEHKGARRKSLQLVPGNTTGSRHCVVESPHVQIFESLAEPFRIETKEGTKIARFPGPLVVALDSWSISHPKHGWMTKICEGVFQTWQQADYTRQRATKD